MDKSKRFYNPFNSDSSRGPDWWFGLDWWFSARSEDELRDFLYTDISFLNRCCKRVYRSLRSASIRLTVKKRQERLTFGHMRSTLASLLGTQRFSFLYVTLL
jgi:hypothetical protein